MKLNVEIISSYGETCAERTTNLNTKLKKWLAENRDAQNVSMIPFGDHFKAVLIEW